MVKVYLSRKGVPFTEHNISMDNKALNHLVEMGYRTTPVTVIDKDVIVGYNPTDLSAALAKLNSIDGLS